MSTATVPKQMSPRTISQRWQTLQGWVVLLLVVSFLYGNMLRNLAQEWWTNEDYSHGLLIPFVLGYLVYQKRDQLQGWPIKHSWFGMVLIVGSQIVNLVGFLGAEFFLQRCSFLIFLAGLILFIYGWKHLWESTFALLLVFLSIPLPSIVFHAIAFPLQLIASSWAEGFLRAVQVPVFREGNILVLSSQTLSVAEACSGIRSLMSLITLGVMVAYFLPFRWWIRGLFITTTVPIALIANSFRVAGTGILGRYFGDAAAQGFFHTFSGWLVFVFALGFLLLEVTLLMRWGSAFKLKENEI